MGGSQPDKPSLAARTLTIRWLVFGLFGMTLLLIALSGEPTVCSDEAVTLDTASGDDITDVVRTCRSPAATDAAVLLPIVALALLILPEVQLGFGGVSLKRAIKETQDQVDAVEKLVTSVIASSDATAQVIIGAPVSPDMVAAGRDDEEMLVWIGQLIDLLFEETGDRLRQELAGSPLSQIFGNTEIDFKVYLHRHDSSLSPVFTSGPAPRDLHLVTFEPGTGVVGFASRYLRYYSVVGLDEVVDSAGEFLLRSDQKDAFRSRAEDGELSPVIAAVPIVDGRGSSIGALSADFEPQMPTPFPEDLPDELRDRFDSLTAEALLDASSQIGAVISRLGRLHSLR